MLVVPMILPCGSRRSVLLKRINRSAPLFVRIGACAGGFLGLDLNVDADGYVGIEAKTGVTRGAEIYFKRRY